MPWNELNLMDNKLLFLADCIRDIMPFSRLCERYGISRKTGYKWLNRYKESQEEGLKELSRRPHSHPFQTPYYVRKKILDLRTEAYITPGAKKIHEMLIRAYPDVTPPSVTTIHKILNQAGLVKPCRRKHRIPLHKTSLKPSSEPNELWSVDFKGEFKLQTGKYCYPLTLMDDNSRYLLGCEGQTTVGHVNTIKTFKRLFKEHGLPQRIRSDNGTPFASKTVGGLSTLSIWWIRLGIYPERIKPGRPQQNGKHERMHRTLKAAVSSPIATSLNAMQNRFERFKVEYNNERPHEALNQQTPFECYRPSQTQLPKRLPELVYPSYFEVKKVRPSGVFYWKNGQVYVSHLLDGEFVGIVEVKDGIYDVYFSFYRLGCIDLESSKDYWTVKV